MTVWMSCVLPFAPVLSRPNVRHHVLCAVAAYIVIVFTVLGACNLYIHRARASEAHATVPAHNPSKADLRSKELYFNDLSSHDAPRESVLSRAKDHSKAARTDASSASGGVSDASGAAAFIDFVPRSSLVDTGAQAQLNMREYTRVALSLLDADAARRTQACADLVSKQPHTCGAVKYVLSTMATDSPGITAEASRCLSDCTAAWQRMHKGSNVAHGTRAYRRRGGQPDEAHMHGEEAREYEVVGSIFDDALKFAFLPTHPRMTEECPACHEGYEKLSESTMVALPCGHAMCEACGRQWINQKATCPVCTAPVFPNAIRVLQQDKLEQSPFHLARNHVIV